MSPPAIHSVSPFFIVRDIPDALTFYCKKLGFRLSYLNDETNPFFAVVQRDGAMLFLKNVEADPLPNSKHNAEVRWDAYFNVPDPDALATEFASRRVKFSAPVADISDGLRGFELEDADGYVLFFGRPRP